VLVLAVATLGTAGACAPTIVVEAAPDAANPACAPVMLALPQTIGGDLDQANTTAQATTAWGTGGAAVTLRCGVDLPGPSTDCQQVDAGGAVVDWIYVTGEDGTWRWTTYGRDPAVEVTVPPAITDTHSTAFLADISQAVSLIEATKTCS
jgi:hypothetical protein